MRPLKRWAISSNSLENVNNKNYHESGSIHLSQVPSMGQQHYPSHSLRRKGRNRDRGPNGPANNGHYTLRSGGGCSVFHGILGGSDGGSLDDLYGAGSDNSSSSYFQT